MPYLPYRGHGNRLYTATRGWKAGHYVEPGGQVWFPRYVKRAAGGLLPRIGNTVLIEETQCLSLSRHCHCEEMTGNSLGFHLSLRPQVACFPGGKITLPSLGPEARLGTARVRVVSEQRKETHAAPWTFPDKTLARREFCLG